MSEELTPKQIDFLKFYLDPKEETFSNAYQSAIKAGFSEEYAKTIVSRNLEWVSESVRRRERILNKAEKRGEELLDAKDDRVKADMVKHFTKTLGKEHYSEKTDIEHSGKISVYKWGTYGKDNILPKTMDKDISREQQEVESDSRNFGKEGVCR